MKSWKTPTRLALLLLAAMLALPLGCAEPQYVRDTEMEDIDEYTMSVRFDRKDVDRLYAENIDKLLSSRIVKQWERESGGGDVPVVAVFPMRNETSEHIGGMLDTLLEKFETDLINRVDVDIVSHRDQPELIAEIKRQQSDAFDPSRLAGYGKQVGAQYFVTGRVYSNTERVEDEKRVQYFMFVTVIDVETGLKKFQTESKITKGLMK